MNKSNLKNKKGFTLVELLAVIVVLAIIILIAMPAVLSSMEKARKNSFAVEANEVIRAAQTAYADAVMNGKASGNNICIPYNYLKNGFLEKHDDNYNGSVLITINPTSGQASYKIYLSNSNYTVDSSKNTPDIDSSKVNQVTSSTTASNDCNKTGTVLN